MKVFHLSVMLCLCLALASCASTSTQKRHGDNWLKPVPVGWEGIDGLDTDEFFEVVHSHVDEALYLVGDSPAVPVEEDTVERLCGRSIKLKPWRKFYLVRAMFANGATGMYGVGMNGDGDLAVSHTALGRVYVKTRSALVVMLKKPPAHVYTHLNSAL
ncbi:MAG: hypothetical protein ACO1TE_27155 [Prosthecobacter sp.]